MKTKFLCPICREKLSGDKTLSCKNKHCFDISKEGYVNLAVGKSGSGDSTDMCRARHSFLSAGYYLKFADGIAESVHDHGHRNAIIDAGCGEGFYMRIMRERFPNAALTGIDLAKDSVRIAAKAEKGYSNRIDYAVAGIFDMPISDKSYDTVLSVFAPVPEFEAARILVKDGIMIVCHPGEKHLSGMKNILYSSPYDNIEKKLEYEQFTKIDERRVRYSEFIKKEDIRNLFVMTPYYWKTSVEDTKRLFEYDGFETELDFLITVFKLK